MSYQLPELPYALSALVPVISEEIMKLHYNGHHAAYVKNLNSALENYKAAEQKQDLAQMIALEKAIKFNGGGHLNHALFWENLAPVGTGGAPSDLLMAALVKNFGSFENFVLRFTEGATALQGSGWCWLGLQKGTGQLHIATCSNQDPLSTLGLLPLLGIDLWEHAYYLQYKNVRADYVKAVWSIVNWNVVSRRYAEMV